MINIEEAMLELNRFIYGKNLTKDDLVEYISKVNYEIKKQNKIIDKMSKFIINVIDNDDAFYYLGNGELLSTSEDVKNYFTKEIENEEEN